jgi:hypothetical protein
MVTPAGEGVIDTLTSPDVFGLTDTTSNVSGLCSDRVCPTSGTHVPMTTAAKRTPEANVCPRMHLAGLMLYPALINNRNAEVAS